MNAIGINGEKHLIRDLHSKAILNTNTGALAQYKTQQKHMQKSRHMEEEINSLKTEITEIKALLIALINKE